VRLPERYGDYLMVKRNYELHSSVAAAQVSTEHSSLFTCTAGVTSAEDDGKVITAISLMWGNQSVCCCTAVVYKRFRSRATNRILKTSEGHTAVKIKIVPQFYKQIKNTQKNEYKITSFKSMSLKKCVLLKSV